MTNRLTTDHFIALQNGKYNTILSEVFVTANMANIQYLWK